MTFEIWNLCSIDFLFLKFKISQLSNCECFLNVHDQLTSSQFFPIQHSFKRKALTYHLQNWLLLMQLLFKFKCPLLKPKPNFILFWIFVFEFFNTHISHLTQHSMINMALKWHHKNIFNKITIFIEFWWSLDVLFGSFDCDYTQEESKLT
jgi:hypothetical protein